MASVEGKAEGKPEGKGAAKADARAGEKADVKATEKSDAKTPEKADAKAAASTPEGSATPAAAPEKKGLGPVYAILIVILLVIMGFQAYMIVKSLQNPTPTTPGQPVAGVPNGPPGQPGQQPGAGAPGAPVASGKVPPGQAGPGGKTGPGGSPGAAVPNAGGNKGGPVPQGPPSPPPGSNIPPGQVALLASPLEVMYGAVLRVHTTPDTKLNAEQAAKIVAILNKNKFTMSLDQASMGFAINAGQLMNKEQLDFIQKNHDVPISLAVNKPMEGGDPTMKPVEEYLIKTSGTTLDSVTAPSSFTPPTSNPSGQPVSAEDVLHGLYHLQKAPANLQLTKDQASKMMPWFKAFIGSRTQGISVKEQIANVMSQTQKAALEKNLLSAGQNPQQTDIRPLTAEQLAAALSGNPQQK